MPAAPSLTAFDDATQIGTALNVVRARIDAVLAETRELRRELVIHRAEEAESEIAEAVKSLGWASASCGRAIRMLAVEEEAE